MDVRYRSLKNEIRTGTRYRRYTVVPACVFYAVFYFHLQSGHPYATTGVGIYLPLIPSTCYLRPKNVTEKTRGRAGGGEVWGRARARRAAGNSTAAISDDVIFAQYLYCIGNKTGRGVQGTSSGSI